MKGRSLKLKDAHKSGGVASFCSVLYDSQSRHLVTSSAADSGVAIHGLDDLSQPPVVLREHKDGVTAIALSPDFAFLASGSVDHSVKIYKFPDGNFQTNITRFTLPIRCLAYNKPGSLLAAAGDDEGIKLIATVDGTISRVLKGHKGAVTGLGFDPSNDYLASVDATGTVIIWELSSGIQIHNLKSIAPNYGSDHSVLNVLSWSPDGEILAVPGLKNDVVMYDRDTAEKLFTLRGDHESPICFLSWSPNGKYMATSSLDRQVLIWDIDQRQDIERQKFEDKISYLAWNPNGNALAIINVLGKFGVWDSVIPSRMKSPIDGAPKKETKTDGLLFFDDDDEDDEEERPMESLNDPGTEAPSESFPTTKKRLRKKPLDDQMKDFSDEEVDSFPQIRLTKKSSMKNKDYTRDKRDENSSLKFERPKVQASFQPGSTPPQAGKKHFLCYNMLGSITTMENDGRQHVEVDFHDTGSGPRVPSMTDFFGFTMAALSESGSVFANPRRDDKSMSTIMYRPFSSWANNSEWSMRFENEEVKAVAIGKDWVAAATDLNILRIFSHGGLQRYIISISGPVVTSVGSGDLLAVITHASDCSYAGDQVLELKVFDVQKRALHMKSNLPLSPGSFLAWFGFGEEGQLCSYDSKGILRVFTHQFGDSWIPLFSADKEKKAEDENYWVVGLNKSKLFCVVCKSPDLYPMVVPKPILSVLPLSFLVASSDLGSNDLENELLMNDMHLSQTQKKIEVAGKMGLDVAELDDEAFDIEAARDRCILRLIANCCNGDKLVRAVELARLLSLEKSLKGAIKLVTALKLPILAERFNGMLEEKLRETSTEVVGNCVEMDTSVLLNGNETASPGTSTLQYSFKPLKVEQEERNCKRGLEDSGKKFVATKPDGAKKLCVKPNVEKGQAEANRKLERSEVVRGLNEKGDTDTENGNIVKRPKNPFAKASTNDEPSLLDSIKKLKVKRAKA